MQLTATEIQSAIINHIEEMTQDWDLELDEPITSDTKLVEDLSFASIDFIQLIVAIEEEFKQNARHETSLIETPKTNVSAPSLSGFRLDTVSEGKKKVSTPNSSLSARITRTLWR